MDFHCNQLILPEEEQKVPSFRTSVRTKSRSYIEQIPSEQCHRWMRMIFQKNQFMHTCIFTSTIQGIPFEDIVMIAMIFPGFIEILMIP